MDEKFCDCGHKHGKLTGLCPECGKKIKTGVEKRGGRNWDKKPNPKSTLREIVGSHGHKPHGPSVLWPAMYEHLRKKGYTKRKSAMISNAAWKKKRMGMKTNTPTSARGIIKSVCPELAYDMDTLRVVSNES